MAAVNRLAAEWDEKAREQKKKERQLKQETGDRGEDMSGDDDDDDDDGEVAADVDWGVLEDEDMLTSRPCRDPSRSTRREASWWKLGSPPLLTAFRPGIGGRRKAGLPSPILR